MGQDTGRNGGISGLVDFPGAGVLFVARIYHAKESLTAEPINRTGPDDAFEDFRQADQGGTLVVSGIMRFDGYPEPASLKGATGTITVTHLYANGAGKASIAYPVAVISSKRERDEKDMSQVDFTLACQIIGQPAYSGYGGSQPAAAGIPSLLTKETREGRGKTMDPSGLDDVINQQFDIVGLDPTDAAEWSQLASFVTAAIASPPVAGMKLRSVAYKQTDSWGGRITPIWSRTTTADDQTNPHTTTRTDADGFDNSAQTSAINGTPSNPGITNTVLAATSTVKLNDGNILSVADWAKWTERQSVDLGETHDTVDASVFDTESTGTFARTFPFVGVVPTISFTGGGGTGAGAIPYTDASGAIAGFIIIPGSGYTSAPTATSSGGSGTGFIVGTATINTMTGHLTGLGIVAGGKGFGGNAPAPPWLPQITITDGTGYGAVIYAVVNAAGAVIDLKVAAQGQNYGAPVAHSAGGYGAGFVIGSLTVVGGRITAAAVGIPGTGYIDNLNPDRQIINCTVENTSATWSKAVFEIGLRTSQNEIEWTGTVTDADKATLPLNSTATATQVALTSSAPSVPAAPLTELKHVRRNIRQHTLSLSIFEDTYAQMDSNDEITVPGTTGQLDPVQLEKEETSSVINLAANSYADLDDLLEATRIANNAAITFAGARARMLPGGNAELIVGTDRSDGAMTARTRTGLELLNSNGTQCMVSYIKARASSLKTLYIAKRPVWRTRGELRIHRRIVSTTYNVPTAGVYSVTHSELVGLVNNAAFLGYPGGGGALATVMYSGYDLQWQQSLDGSNHLFVGDYVFGLDSLGFQDDSMVLAGDFIETSASVSVGETNISTFGWSLFFPAAGNLSVLLP